MLFAILIIVSKVRWASGVKARNCPKVVLMLRNDAIFVIRRY